MKTIIAKPLTRASFAPFGDVMEMEGAAHYPINNGMTTRYHDLANIEATGPNAKIIVSLFAGQPYALPLELLLVERHPLGSQAFYPLDGKPWLVIVARDENGEPSDPEAFLASGIQGVNYPAGQWHGVLTPFGAPQNFIVIDRGGDGKNLEEFTFETPYQIALEGM